MRKLVIENDVIVNIIEVEEGFTSQSLNLIDDLPDSDIGRTVVNGVVQVPVEPPPVYPPEYVGVLAEGVMCSATDRDVQNYGSVRGYIADGNNVDFPFANGNNLIITAANQASFEAIWIPFAKTYF